MNCPKCGSSMVKRYGKRGPFMGCSRYPRCNGTAKAYVAQPERRRVDYSNRVWSEYQLAIFDAVGRTDDNLVVTAVAGSGKTTTAVAALNYATRYQRVAFVAFNRSIAKDFADKVPEGVSASTYHALGLKSITAVCKVKVEESKNFMIYQEIVKNMPEGSRSVVEEYRSEILRLVSLIKNTLATPDIDGLVRVADTYNIDIGAEDEGLFVLDTANRILQQSLKDENTIDFDDMIYWCATGRVEPLAFDLVVTDEMQDTNAARLEMLLRMLRNGGRSIAVGDRNQAIYGWAGAHTSAMDAFVAETNAKELKLSITYRCPLSHVELAQQIVPEIQARPNAPMGILGDCDEYQMIRNLQDGDMVLCRVNAPLVKPAFQRLAEGKKAIIVGKDIGTSLVSLVNRMAEKANKTTSATLMLNEFDSYVGKQCERLERSGKFSKADYLRDQLATTEAISDGCETVDEVSRKIEGIFGDERTEGVRFSSVHRAKGLEAADEKSVYIMRPELMPFPRTVESGDEAAIQQEWNIKYVAETRSRHAMYMVRK
jgi:DNA helicase-2/ATP-dependent DNA helicase PcrA